ncbi:MAG: type IV pilus modification protein PilV [Desulfuromonas sp.]|nr:type IV pilus modification protein PilV [Desulfuromonas sp.]
MQQAQRKKDSGFTLIEVLIAMVIFAVGILGIAMMQLSAVRGNSVANRVSEASTLASDQIEQMLSWDYSDAELKENNNINYTLADGSNEDFDGHQAGANSNYDIYWNVEENTPAANSKTVEVTVLWFDKGQRKTVSLSTIKVAPR